MRTAPSTETIMKGNKLLKEIFNSHEKLAKLVRWSGKGWDLVYKWCQDSESAEPSPLQRTLDLIDLVYLIDPSGARQVASLPLEHYRELVAGHAAHCSLANQFENAFRGLKETTEAGEALTDGQSSLEQRERELVDVIQWAEENLEIVRQSKAEREKHWQRRTS
jgi:hypothetical protein